MPSLFFSSSPWSSSLMSSSKCIFYFCLNFPLFSLVYSSVQALTYFSEEKNESGFFPSFSLCHKSHKHFSSFLTLITQKFNFISWSLVSTLIPFLMLLNLSLFYVLQLSLIQYSIPFESISLCLCLPFWTPCPLSYLGLFKVISPPSLSYVHPTETAFNKTFLYFSGKTWQQFASCSLLTISNFWHYCLLFEICSSEQVSVFYRCCSGWLQALHHLPTLQFHVGFTNINPYSLPFCSHTFLSANLSAYPNSSISALAMTHKSTLDLFLFVQNWNFMQYLWLLLIHGELSS